MSIPKIAWFLTGLLSTVVGASAQSDTSGSRWSVGVTGAYTQSFHTGGFRSYTEALCGKFVDISGGGYQLGIAARFAPGGPLALDCRATFDSRPGAFESTSSGCALLIPGSSQPVVHNVRGRSEIVYKLATLDMILTARVRVSRSIMFTTSLGPTISSVREGYLTQYEEVIAPDSARFANFDGYPTENDGRRIYYVRDMRIPTMSSARFSIKAGLGIDAELAGPLTMRAGVYYDRAITDVTDSEIWQVHSLLGELTFLVAL